jgi:hypothetical protein
VVGIGFIIKNDAIFFYYFFVYIFITNISTNILLQTTHINRLYKMSLLEIAKNMYGNTNISVFIGLIIVFISLFTIRRKNNNTEVKNNVQVNQYDNLVKAREAKKAKDTAKRAGSVARKAKIQSSVDNLTKQLYEAPQHSQSFIRRDVSNEPCKCRWNFYSDTGKIRKQLIECEECELKSGNPYINSGP